MSKKLQCKPIVCPKPNTTGYLDGTSSMPNKISLIDKIKDTNSIKM